MKTISDIIKKYDAEMVGIVKNSIEWESTMHESFKRLASELCQHRQIELDNIMAEQDAEALDDQD